jgi:hypothetical protein
VTSFGIDSEQALVGFCAGLCADLSLGVKWIPRVHKLMQRAEYCNRFNELAANIKNQLVNEESVSGI